MFICKLTAKVSNLLSFVLVEQPTIQMRPVWKFIQIEKQFENASSRSFGYVKLPVFPGLPNETKVLKSLMRLLLFLKSINKKQWKSVAKV